MDGCSLSDAFPSGGVGSADCIDTRSAEISRRQEKKRARKCRGPHLTYLNGGMNMVGPVDPDRQTVKPMPEVPALNTKTGMYEHVPVEEQYPWEGFVGGMDDLPSIQKDVRGPNELQTGAGSLASFFGVNPNDGSANPVSPKKGLIENFSSGVAPYVNVIGDDESFLLKPDFTKSFQAQGAQKAGGVAIPSGPSPTSEETNYLTPTKMLPNSILPFPNTDMFWRTNPVTGGQGSFFAQLRAPGGQPSGTPTEGSEEPTNKKEVMEKLDRIFARLNDMEYQKAENAQTEVLLFIMTGLGVIFLMDIGCRAAAALGSRR
jgi:hypothetical protein